jgi:formylglycine-generating enzyme required for sulfatase activity/serine/threonine protein kinase
MLRTCAIKLLTNVSSGNEDAVPRFKGEARMASRIDNEHAVRIYDFGQTSDKLLFLAMEFIDGKPLSRVIAQERALPVERVVHITEQIAEALTAAHALKIIHRDLKPDNIMITRKGTESEFVKVLDFGIAKSVADNRENLTKTGFVLGTPVYMSPEQVLGEELDPRSDLYSLAIIVYEMLSGRLPFTGDNPQSIMMKRIIGEPTRLRAAAPGISESIERVVMEGLARDRDSRTPNVQVFAAELARATSGVTQIMGGVVTGRLGDRSPERDTREREALQTKVDSSPAFTGQAGPSAASAGEPSPWAVTEVSFSAAEAARGARPSGEAYPQSEPSINRGAEVATTRRKTSKLAWAGAALAILVIAAVLYIVMPSSSAAGFTVIVKGAPTGSKVYVNDTLRDSHAAAGGLEVSGVGPGQVNIRVSHEGFADFITTLVGAQGETKTCEASLLPEIDYGGIMVPIPAGEFEMGSNSFEADERPAHTLNLPAYYIDKYEVTNAEYKKFCDATGKAPPPNPPFEPDYFTAKPDYPVLGVTFEDALAFASWAGKRLPTEEEWEKAASWDPLARKKRLYAWGDESPVGRGNIGTGKPVPVNQANGDISAYGVVNMSGNVLEWVDAPYKPYNGNDAPDPNYSKDERVIRGAAFLQELRFNEARTSYRDHLPRVFPKGKSTAVGIRCVVRADDPRIQGLLQSRTQ